MPLQGWLNAVEAMTRRDTHPASSSSVLRQPSVTKVAEVNDVDDGKNKINPVLNCFKVTIAAVWASRKGPR